MFSSDFGIYSKDITGFTIISQLFLVLATASYGGQWAPSSYVPLAQTSSYAITYG